MEDSESEIDYTEGLGAINFLSLDDIVVSKEGEPLNNKSIVQLEHDKGEPLFPAFFNEKQDVFLRQINASNEKWVVFVDEDQMPSYIMDADGFLRAVLFDDTLPNPRDFMHKPIVIDNAALPLGDVIHLLNVSPKSSEDDVIDHDVILLWSDEKRVITGADILGRLLRGIVKHN